MNRDVILTSVGALVMEVPHVAYLLTICAMQINVTITKTALELDTGAMIRVMYSLILSDKLMNSYTPV